MALSSKISSIYIRKAGGSSWSYTITTNNFTSDIGQVNFGSAYDEALDASLRQNLRGFRFTLELNWAKLLSSTFAGSGGGGNTASAFLQDLVSAFTGGDSYVEVSFSGSFTTLFDDTNGATANAFKFILDSSTITTAYTNQIGRGSANIRLIGQELATTIPAALQAPSV
jgi:hypothetical protein